MIEAKHSTKSPSDATLDHSNWTGREDRDCNSTVRQHLEPSVTAPGSPAPHRQGAFASHWDEETDGRHRFVTSGPGMARLWALSQWPGPDPLHLYRSPPARARTPYRAQGDQNSSLRQAYTRSLLLEAPAAGSQIEDISLHPDHSKHSIFFSDLGWGSGGILLGVRAGCCASIRRLRRALISSVSAPFARSVTPP